MTVHVPDLSQLFVGQPRDLAFENAVWLEGALNTSYLIAHEQEFAERYQGQCVLIHSGDTHEAFDDLPDLLQRYDKLSRVSQAAAEIEFPHRPNAAYYY